MIPNFRIAFWYQKLSATPKGPPMNFYWQTRLFIIILWHPSSLFSKTSAGTIWQRQKPLDLPKNSVGNKRVPLTFFQYCVIVGRKNSKNFWWDAVMVYRSFQVGKRSSFNFDVFSVSFRFSLMILGKNKSHRSCAFFSGSFECHEDYVLQNS